VWFHFWISFHRYIITEFLSYFVAKYFMILLFRWRLYKLVPFSFPPYNFAGVVNPIWHTTRVGATTWLVFDQGRRMSMLAPYIFPQRATLLEHLPDNGLWKST
jgi:hypothetical protein|tara:strand:+ start:1682 stop:1990 length:309 start_codon:yes stop_codon:yes gene_type:complete